jgi:hypothetical protein
MTTVARRQGSAVWHTSHPRFAGPDELLDVGGRWGGRPLGAASRVRSTPINRDNSHPDTGPPRHKGAFFILCSAQKLRQLRQENRELEQLVADLSLDKTLHHQALRDGVRRAGS